MENVKIFALGGQDENGKNSYVFSYNNDLYIINSGVKIPINSKNGVDTLIPDFTFLEKNKDKIKGIFITDIRNESFSALPWLLMKIPNIKIYTSFLNKHFIQERLQKYNINLEKLQVRTITEKTKIGSIFVQPISLPGSTPGNLGFNFITKTGDYLFMFNYVEGDLGIFGKTWFYHLPKLFGKRKLNAIVSDAGRSKTNGLAIDKVKLPLYIEQAFQKADKNSKIVIGAYSAMIDNFIGTVHKQVLWANYEYELYNGIWDGKISGSYDSISKLYFDNLQKYNAKKLKYSTQNTIQSIYVPHYYYGFYVYKYAIGQLVAIYFFKQYKEKGDVALKNYIDNFLSAGGKDYPINILKYVGVDLNDTNFYKDGFNFIEEAIEEWIKLGKQIFKLK